MNRNKNQMQMDDSDDDNYSQASSTSSIDHLDEPTTSIDPLLSSIDDLETRIVSSLNEFKLHSGIKTNTSNTSDIDIHSELKDILRPVLEIAAHTGPATARSKWHQSAYRPTIDLALEEIHHRLNEELIFPVLLESAQSDLIPSKRAAALGFFHNLHSEYKSPGSYLDYHLVEQTNVGFGASMNMHMNKYTGALYGRTQNKNQDKVSQSDAYLWKQRLIAKEKKRAMLLRYWVEGSTACTVPGAFTDVHADGAIASRAVISSSAVIRPALRHVSERIRGADDAGALRLFIPVMRMIGGVLKRLFAANAASGGGKNSGSGGSVEEKSVDAVKSACVKFLEIVVLSFSTRSQSGAGGRRKQNVSMEDFALEDLPMGHPVITRQALEEIGEDAFTVLRGLAMMGGQVKVDSGVISDVRMSLGLDSSGMGSTPSLQIVGILRPAALSYLEIESTMIGQRVSKENPFPIIDRSDIETDFLLNQKSYALTINAVSMLATNRPTFFGDSASCLARRALDPPTVENSSLSKAATMTVCSHLRASCLTLLRNALSVTSGSFDILQKALSSDECGMKIQAEKALRMAKQAASLKTAGRKARNEAAIFYEWEGEGAAGAAGSALVETVGSKRKRAGQDKLEQMRAAKAARGLGNGIQLPKSMADACELILLNLGNLPSSRAVASVGDKKKSKSLSEQKRRRPFTFDYFVDAIMTNGASLVSDENRWYGRDGGDAWVMDISALISEDEAEGGDERMGVKSDLKKKAPVPVTFTLDTKTANAAIAAKNGESSDDVKMYQEQCEAAAADAFGRILDRSRAARDPSIADFGNQIAARMAWTLKKLKPQNELKGASDAAIEGATTISKKVTDTNAKNKSLDNLPSFAKEFPLVSSCIQFDLETNAMRSDGVENESLVSKPTSSLTQRLLNEAFLGVEEEDEGSVDKSERFDKTLELYISSVLQACEKADEKPMDNQRKKLASAAASSLSKDLGLLPAVTESALELASRLCDIDEISRKAAEASRKTSNQNLATAAATNAAKAASEKRAKAILLALRDAAFQRSKSGVRQYAVNCAVGLASGRLPASQAVEEMALKLVMNVIYPKATDLATQVVAAATRELERAATYSIENNKKIREANEDAMAKKPDQQSNHALPLSDVEKTAIEHVKKPANLFMALCIRRPEIIKDLMTHSCKEGADVLVKAVRNNMPKLARAAAKKYGSAKIALQVAELADTSETSLLLSFLDNLAPAAGTPPAQDLIDACIKIQEERLEDGQKDPRFIIPVVSGMKRTELENRLPELVGAEDLVFMASLRRMSERLKRNAYSFREEAGDEPLVGMTLCEQLVYLHQLDFAAANMRQKRYLQSISLCLDNVEVYTDRVIMAALDHMSGMFLIGQSLPLGYMRTVIMTCTKHESLHSWICNALLPRLIEGKVYNEGRQWEGWMRCARMLEGGDGGVSSMDAIKRLPEEQYETYRNKYPKM